MFCYITCFLEIIMRWKHSILLWFAVIQVYAWFCRNWSSQKMLLAEILWLFPGLLLVRKAFPAKKRIKGWFLPIYRVSKSCDRATVRSRKKFQRLRKIWVFERKNAQFTTVLPFLGHFSKNLFVFGPFCLRKTFKQKYWSRKKNCF